MKNVTKKIERKFLPANWDFKSWEDVAPYYQVLADRSIESDKELLNWQAHRDELSAVISENAAWRYIKMTLDTQNLEIKAAYELFVEKIQPNLQEWEQKLDLKEVASPYFSVFEQAKYLTYTRQLKKKIEMYRQENLVLFSELSLKSSEFRQISSTMTIEHSGEEITLQQANSLLQSTDREIRKEVFEKIRARRFQEKDVLDQLMTDLIQLRHKIATNAGYDNFRDYQFDAMGRFDYTPEDCLEFHQSVQETVVPILNRLAAKRKKNLGYETLKPYDLLVDELGREPLTPFQGENELVEKSITCLKQTDPYFGECVQTMRDIQYLDLASRKGKAPGGYNYPLFESGIPFIFMNSVGSSSDVLVMMHESGHAVQSFLTRDLEFLAHKTFPSEIAELASMSMELMTMDALPAFYSNEEDLSRAKASQLSRAIDILPRTMLIDAFQHWMYTNPDHTVEARNTEFNRLQDKFKLSEVDWSGYEQYATYSWHGVLHIFEVPFYYIEYAMAQLGALAVYRNYKTNRTKAIDDYKNAMSLGYQNPIGEVYEAANVRFDFSSNYIAELAKFIETELNAYQ